MHSDSGNQDFNSTWPSMLHGAMPRYGSSLSAMYVAMLARGVYLDEPAGLRTVIWERF